MPRQTEFRDFASIGFYPFYEKNARVECRLRPSTLELLERKGAKWFKPRQAIASTALISLDATFDDLGDDVIKLQESGKLAVPMRHFDLATRALIEAACRNPTGCLSVDRAVWVSSNAVLQVRWEELK